MPYSGSVSIVRCRADKTLGDANVGLNPGEHTYSLRYRSDRQIGFFASRDELYWNVTGNGWAFPIDSASATVRLPA